MAPIRALSLLRQGYNITIYTFDFSIPCHAIIVDGGRMKTIKVWPRKFVYIYFKIRTCNGKVYIFSGSHLIKLDAMHTTLPSGLKITTTQKQINFLTFTFFYLFNRLISFLQFPMSASLYSNSHFLKISEKTKQCNARGEKYNLITFCGCLLQACGMFKQLLRKKSLSKNGQLAMISVI